MKASAGNGNRKGKRIPKYFLIAVSKTFRHNESMQNKNNDIITLNQDYNTPDFDLIKGDKIKPINVWYTGEIYCLRVEVLSGEFQGELADIDLTYLLGGD
jgi:hypothetical protein